MDPVANEAKLEQLNTANPPIAKIKAAMPTPQIHYVKPVETTTPTSMESQTLSTNRRTGRYEWIEKVIEKELPDGRNASYSASYQPT